LGLNERQLDALLFFKTKGEIISSEYVKRYNINDRTARRDLTELVEKNYSLSTEKKRPQSTFTDKCPIPQIANK